MKLDATKIKEYITEPNLGIELRPLLLFNGNLTEGKAISRFNFLRAAMDAEVSTLTEFTKLSIGANDDAHLCGFHAKFGWERMGIQGFLGRVLDSPTILDRTTGVKDYIHWICGNTVNCHPLKLTRISEASYRSRRDWRRRQRVAPMAEVYPYIVGTPTNDHDLLLAVESLVPKTFLADERADLCQDMIVSILTGEISLDNLRDRRGEWIKTALRNAPSKYGPLSLDAPVYLGEGKSRTLGETIV